MVRPLVWGVKLAARIVMVVAMGIDDSTVGQARPTEFVAALRTRHVIARVIIGFLREGLTPRTRLPTPLTSQALELETRVLGETDFLCLALQQHLICARPLPHRVLAAGSGMGAAAAIPTKGVLAARACAAMLAAVSPVICAEEAVALRAHLDMRIGPNRDPQVELIVVGPE